MTAFPLVQQVKYLGMKLNSRPNLSTHVEYTKGKAIKRIAIIKSIAGKRFGADRATLLRLYSMFVRPILEYGSHILDGDGHSKIEALETVHSMCLRIAAGALRTSPVKDLQVDTHVFPLELRLQGLLLW